MGNVIAVASTTLSGIVTADMMSGVFDELIAMLPVVVPAAIGYIGVRKGLQFLFSTLRRA